MVGRTKLDVREREYEIRKVYCYSLADPFPADAHRQRPRQTPSERESFELAKPPLLEGAGSFGMATMHQGLSFADKLPHALPGMVPSVCELSLAIEQ